MELPYYNLGLPNVRLLAPCKRKMERKKNKKKLLLLYLFLALTAPTAYVWPEHSLLFTQPQCFKCLHWVRPVSGGCKLSMCRYTRLVLWWAILTKFWWLIASDLHLICQLQVKETSVNWLKEKRWEIYGSMKLEMGSGNVGRILSSPMVPSLH